MRNNDPRKSPAYLTTSTNECPCRGTLPKSFHSSHRFDRDTCLNIMLMLLLFANDTRFITILLLSRCHDCCNGG
jgi:hypothetical protein